MTLVVFTAIIGEADALRSPTVVDPDVRYVCFSDRKTAVPPYQWIHVPPSDRPRLESRRLKILADHPALDGADATLWHDASYQLTAGPAWVAHELRTVDIVGLSHAKRSLIEQEGRKIASYGYLERADAIRLAAQYRLDGFLSDGITTGGLLGRRVSAATALFNALWWQETQRWGGRDQAALDYAAFMAGCSVGHVKGRVTKNAYARWRQIEAVPA